MLRCYGGEATLESSIAARATATTDLTVATVMIVMGKAEAEASLRAGGALQITHSFALEFGAWQRSEGEHKDGGAPLCFHRWTSSLRDSGSVRIRAGVTPNVL